MCDSDHIRLVWADHVDVVETFGLIRRFDIPLSGQEMEIRVNTNFDTPDGWSLVPHDYWSMRGRAQLQQRISVLFEFCQCADIVELVVSFVATAADMRY